LSSLRLFSSLLSFLPFRGVPDLFSLFSSCLFGFCGCLSFFPFPLPLPPLFFFRFLRPPPTPSLRSNHAVFLICLPSSSRALSISPSSPFPSLFYFSLTHTHASLLFLNSPISQLTHTISYLSCSSFPLSPSFQNRAIDNCYCLPSTLPPSLPPSLLPSLLT